MNLKTRSIRPFIGAKDFKVSREFYRDLGFAEIVLGPKMSVFKMQQLAFYLQDYYVQDWIDNTMVFVEVESVDDFWHHLQSLELAEKFPTSKFVPIRELDWGKECFVHDPSGVLWHFGQFFDS